VRTATTTVALVLALAGCGAPPTSGAARVAGMFYRALSDDHGRLACRQLSPETLHDVVQTAGAPCRTAILRENVPEQGRVLDVERFGNEAQVRGSGDTAFLSEFPEGWKIIAVGCSPRPPLPYDCEVKS
jgi:hypothetical protein